MIISIKKILLSLIIASTVVIFFPFITHAQTEGLARYDCTGSPNNAVGREHAGGIFVPVSEEAIAHNTNVLVYKECVLDVIYTHMRESAVAFIVKSTFNWVNSNFDGQKAYIVNQVEFRLQVKEKVKTEFLEGDRTENICNTFKDDVKRTLDKDYEQQVHQPENAYSCNVPEEKKEAFEKLLNGEAPFTWDAYLQVIQPQNNPLGAFLMARDQLNKDLAEKVNDEYTELQWGQGYKSSKSCRQIPARNGTNKEYCEIVTPGTTIRDIVNFVSLTGQRQTEQADEIDELMGSLMTNIHTQILTSANGLSGMTDSEDGGYDDAGGSTDGQSYVDLVASDAAQRVETNFVDTGLDQLTEALAAEIAYSSIVKEIQDTLNATAKQIQSKESSCWDGLIARAKIDITNDAEKKACDARGYGDLGGTDANGGCTIQGTSDTHVITSTIQTQNGLREYDVEIKAHAADVSIEKRLHVNQDNSYQVIKQYISPLLRVTNEAVNTSAEALTRLKNLQNSLASSNTPQNTQYVTQQLIDLSKSGKLHSTADVSAVQAKLGETKGVMRDTYNKVEETWNAGWCNPSNWDKVS